MEDDGYSGLDEALKLWVWDEGRTGGRVCGLEAVYEEENVTTPFYF